MTDAAETTLNGTYNLYLVTLSIVVAMISSYAALDLANLATASAGRARRAWLAGGAIMIVGIRDAYLLVMLVVDAPVARDRIRSIHH